MQMTYAATITFWSSHWTERYVALTFSRHSYCRPNKSPTRARLRPAACADFSKRRNWCFDSVGWWGHLRCLIQVNHLANFPYLPRYLLQIIWARGTDSVNLRLQAAAWASQCAYPVILILRVCSWQLVPVSVFWSTPCPESPHVDPP